MATTLFHPGQFFHYETGEPVEEYGIYFDNGGPADLEERGDFGWVEDFEGLTLEQAEQVCRILNSRIVDVRTMNDLTRSHFDLAAELAKSHAKAA